MKSFLLVFAGLLALAGVAHATLTADQIYLLNNKMGYVPHKIQLGTLLQNVETVANSALAQGNIWIGNGAGTATALSVKGDTKILVGNGTTATSVLVSGDATLSNAGALTIGAKKVTEGKIAIASGKILVGQAGGEALAVTPSGDATISTAGVVAIGAGKVLESMLQVPAAEALGVKRMAKVVYDVATDLGTQAAHGLGVTLPAKAIITRSFFYTVTQFADAGAGTVALSCETANNIFSAADITGNAAGTIVTGVSDGTVGNMKPITAACEVTATVATADQTQGKLNIFIEYVVAE